MSLRTFSNRRHLIVPTAVFASVIAMAGLVLLSVSFPGAAIAVGANQASPFPALAGRWTGQGKLGLKDSPAETVKCRATYFVSNQDNTLKQTIRCATSGGAIEVKSEVHHDNGKLSGHWKETMRNLEGGLSGEVTDRGFKITVKSRDLSANMDIAVKADRQLVEIQFHNSSLVGLTLLMRKG